MKALYIIANVGFAEEIVEMTRNAGAKGATIMNARGTADMNKAFFGITTSPEKEIILTLVDAKVVDTIMAEVGEKAGVKTPAGAVCFCVPVEKAVGIRFSAEDEKAEQ